jgi:hypothetical protein
MTIFDIISDIAFAKKTRYLDSCEDESAFSPYLTNRWLSMYSPLLAKTSNIINKYLMVFDDKQSLYKLFLNSFPKVTSKRINYFKKNKIEKEESNNKQAAYTLEISTREVEQYIDFQKHKIN